MTRINGRFRDDLVTVAVVLLFLGLMFAPSLGFAIWGEAGLS